MANEFVTKSVDALWDNWLNGFKSLQQVQVEAEKKTLEALEVQQQLVEKTVQSLAAVEAQSKQFAEQWQQTVKASTAQLPAQPQFAQWLETVQQITEQTQQFAWKPNSIFADTLTQTQTQWNDTVKSALEQQQEKREEVLTKIEELTVQLKDSQKRLLDSIPAVPGV
ncbi:hypothetical protein [Caryophanon latum]|uniref:Polyhydroxyalkanoic acid inclusion protein PhaP n=1 Tax=Caryophanon latum TaxID=33977 RepID=A0A1C0YEE4_9BACL|nr:hypothetical protein [Caryophanon latum]OCS85547.1 hypothetical protein A6K76_15040 [Caryophanon latum]